MYKRINRMAYLNITVVGTMMVLHLHLEIVSKFVFFGILLTYAIINGAYIQREIKKQLEFEEKFMNEKNMSDLILESIPTAVAIIDTSGVIKYLNNSVGKILGSMDTIGKNILEFDTVIDLGLDVKIQEAIDGHYSEMIAADYMSFTSREKLVLNIRVKPFKYIGEKNQYQVIMLMDDITRESGLKIKVEAQYLEMARSFSKIIDAKDPYTGQHSSNVSDYVDDMLKLVEISDQEKYDIHAAAALHDIGKIGISEYILNKPGQLTDEEYQQMKTHSSIGANLLDEIDNYSGIALNIRHHHERWDGGGYPDGLKSNQIPLGSQLIAIADTYDAIVSERIYRKSRSKSEAIDILKKERWLQLNGDFVDLFVDNILTSGSNISVNDDNHEDDYAVEVS